MGEVSSRTSAVVPGGEGDTRVRTLRCWELLSWGSREGGLITILMDRLGHTFVSPAAPITCLILIIRMSDFT